MLWGAIELPRLGLEIASHGTDPTTPLALVEDNRIRICNDAATASGVRTGSTLATAVSICHGLRHVSRNAKREQHRIEVLAGAAYRFSAQVSIHESASRPVALLLDLSGSLKLFGGLYRLKRQLIALFDELGHQVALGIGHTPLAALALARARITVEAPRFPDAEFIRTITTRALRTLPLTHVELDDELLERFENMGLISLGQLLKLPQRALGKRFGRGLLDYLARLSGQTSDPRIYFRPASEFCTSLHLLESISNKTVLLFPMQRLVRDLASWLVGRQLGATRLRWTFTPLEGLGATLTIDLAEGVQSHQALLAISRLKLEGSALPAEIDSITLEAPRLSAWEAKDSARSTLFMERGKHYQTPFSLIDDLKARLGSDVCHGIAVFDDCRPERAWQPTAPDLTKKAPPTSARVQERPLWLLANPEPIAARTLTLLKGPERIVTGWWGDAAGRVERDYYIARHTNGTQCWVFSDARKRWYLHGCFA